jgi:DNA-binding NarL/FixJ family response regulator
VTHRVIIADDHPIFRRGLRTVIEEDSPFRVIGEAGDGREALALLRAHADAVAVLDLEMPEIGGLELLTQTRSWPKPPRVVILTMHDDCADRALELGAMGYLLKDHASDEVVACLHAVVRGSRYLSRGLSVSLDARGAVVVSGPVAQLTTTERRVVRLLGQLKTSREIAELMSVSVRTVQNHRQNACRKLGLQGNQSLLRFALEHEAELK